MAIRATASQHEATAPVNRPKTESPAAVREAVDRAGRRIAPLWPLRHFVAVNPYLGLIEKSFEDVAHTLGRRAGARMTLTRAFYANAIQSERIIDADLEAALDQGSPLSGAPKDVRALKEFALNDTSEIKFEVVSTIADVARDVTGKDWADFVTESISRWAGTYFDQGQSYWKSPWADLSPYAAWRAEAAVDRTPEVMGLHHFRKTVAQLPDSAIETVETAINILEIPMAGLETYLHRLLLTIHGWASYARYQLWEAELYEREDDTLIHVLAIRLAWEVGLMKAFEKHGLFAAWKSRRDELVESEIEQEQQAILAGDLLLQRAFEKAYQRELFSRVASSQQVKPEARRQVQAAFCIDVRSEVFRRALETVSDGVETIGFAGFFGFPIEYVRLGDTHGGAQCPALLTPQFVIAESVSGASEGEVNSITTMRAMRQRIAKAWRMFKFGAVSCFGFVGPVGLAYIKNLVLDTLGQTRPVPLPASYGIDKTTYKRLTPTITPGTLGERIVGMTPEQRLDIAEGVLKAMSLTDNFARIVLLAGHGSSTVNNPYATGLDCGACGGHTGEANARVAAQVLNDHQVRVGLLERGIAIPDDTVFAAAQHDTTTDEVTIFDSEKMPASHMTELEQLEANLVSAGRLARAERASLLNVRGQEQVDNAVIRRSTDWSQLWRAGIDYDGAYGGRELDQSAILRLHSRQCGVWQRQQGAPQCRRDIGCVGR